MENANKNRMIDSAEITQQLDTAAKIKSINDALGEHPMYFIQTLGCQQNEADSERIAGMCELMGYFPTNDPAKAKLIFVNTCAVREHAEKRALSLIGEYKHVKDLDPEVIIGVGGCMVTQGHRSDKMKHSFPYVNFVFDTGSLHKIPELVFGALGKAKRRFVSCGEEFKIAEGIPSARAQNFKAWLSIMYGCNNFCSYCIVPYVRGRERSRLPSDILTEARELIAGGAKDITLLGQNVNSYGKDLSGETISDLMRQICKIDGDFRLRFMTSHPKDASGDLIEVIAEEPKVAKHFHLPVQSGSDRILKLMNRRYTAEKYLDVVKKLKAAVPDITLTSDIIVGFPGETEDDFRATLELIKEVGYDAVFSFIYSPRVGTPAAEMEGQIEKEVATERMSRLLELTGEISLKRNRRFEGRTLKVLVEERSKNDVSFLTGRADSPRPIHFKGDDSLIGNFANIKITKAEQFSMNGEIIN